MKVFEINPLGMLGRRKADFHRPLMGVFAPSDTLAHVNAVAKSLEWYIWPSGSSALTVHVAVQRAPEYSSLPRTGQHLRNGQFDRDLKTGIRIAN